MSLLLKERLKLVSSIIAREFNYRVNRFPLSAASLEITNKCNLKCQMCDFGREKRSSQNELNLDEWKRVLDEMLRLGLRWVNFVGAEPLVRKDDVLEMARYLNGKKVYKKLSTNGTLINGALAEQIAELFQEVAISLDAPDERHDRIRGQSNIFKVVRDGIKMLKEARDKQKTNQPLIDIHTTIFNSNYNLLEDMVNLAQELRADLISFQYITQNSRDAVMGTRLNGEGIGSSRYIIEPNSLFLNETQIYELRRQISNIKRKKRKVRVVLKLLSSFSEDVFLNGAFPIHRCYIIRNRVIISCEGDVQVCSHLNYPLGNVRKEPLDKIWGNDKHRELARYLSLGLFPVCANCCHFSVNLTPGQYCRLKFDMLLK